MCGVREKSKFVTLCPNSTKGIVYSSQEISPLPYTKNCVCVCVYNTHNLGLHFVQDLCPFLLM